VLIAAKHRTRFYPSLAADFSWASELLRQRRAVAASQTSEPLDLPMVDLSTGGLPSFSDEAEDGEGEEDEEGEEGAGEEGDEMGDDNDDEGEGMIIDMKRDDDWAFDSKIKVRLPVTSH